MPSTKPARTIWDIELPDVNATEHLAMDIAATLAPGDLVTLSGDLGAGKTTLARAILRYLAGNAELEVPSPTFTIFQTYELPQFPVVHADLFRITTLAELSEIGWDEAAEGAAVLVEWPDRAGSLVQVDRLDVALAIAPEIDPSHRMVRLTGHGKWAGRLAQLRAARALLDASGFGAALRQRLQGDASTRSYERLHLREGTAVLMKMPPNLREPPLQNGRSYSAVAHLAEDVRPFVAMARGLRDRGFSAPDLYAADLEHGLLLIEDLGSQLFVEGDPPVPVEERYAAAVDLLVVLHTMALPASLPIAPRLQHILAQYDIDAFLIECELLYDWYLPHRKSALRDAASREAFLTIWRLVLGDMTGGPPTWVLRDYHSPNLLWMPERTDVQRVGLLDFQDAVLGPPAYDVASLLMDARVDVSEALEVKLLSRYVAGRKRYDPAFDPALFASQYVVLGAQRATKVLGIFARLDLRDRKPQFVRHMPRVWNYLMRSFEHPALAEVKAWYMANVPPPAMPASPIAAPMAPEVAPQAQAEESFMDIAAEPVPAEPPLDPSLDPSLESPADAPAEPPPETTEEEATVAQDSEPAPDKPSRP